MLRSLLGKLLWLGRATSAVVGLAVVLALVVGVSSAALAGNLDALKIGSVRNVATTTTALVGKVVAGESLAVKNPSGGPALGLQVQQGQAPLTVNSPGKVANLNADTVDGKSDTDFYAAGSKVADSAHADNATNAGSATNAQNASNADELDGLDSTELKPLYKYVAGNGYAGFGSSSGVRSVSKPGVGHYVVEFDRPVHGCTRVANIDLGPGISSSGDSNFVRGGGATTYNHIGEGNSKIGVFTRDSSGNLADRGFGIAVFC